MQGGRARFEFEKVYIQLELIIELNDLPWTFIGNLVTRDVGLSFSRNSLGGRAEAS
jgi:hypothetical protein